MVSRAAPSLPLPEALPGEALSHYERLAKIEMGPFPEPKSSLEVFSVYPWWGRRGPTPQSRPDLFRGLRAHTARLPSPMDLERLPQTDPLSPSPASSHP